MAQSGIKLARSVAKAPGAWKSISARREQIEKAAKQLHIEQWPQDWYSVTRGELYRVGGPSMPSILRYHQSSLVIALLELFPEHSWKPWKFRRTPSGVWAQRSFRRAYFDSLATELKLTTRVDWYRVTYAQILAQGGAGLLASQYNDSLIQALKDVYPEHTWMEWQFSQMPADFLDRSSNQIRLMGWLADQLGIRQPSDWYTVEANTVAKLPGGSSLLNRHSSLYNALCATYPDHRWKPWMFRFASPLMWNHKPTRKLFADSLVHEPRELTELSVSEIEKLPGGSGWLKYYGGSLFTASSDLYPALGRDAFLETRVD